jgi:hypothetical protein
MEWRRGNVAGEVMAKRMGMLPSLTAGTVSNAYTGAAAGGGTTADAIRD